MKAFLLIAVILLVVLAAFAISSAVFSTDNAPYSDTSAIQTTLTTAGGSVKTQMDSAGAAATSWDSEAGTQATRAGTDASTNATAVGNAVTGS